jgi:hypothetical protein
MHVRRQLGGRNEFVKIVSACGKYRIQSTGRQFEIQFELTEQKYQQGSSEECVRHRESPSRTLSEFDSEWTQRANRRAELATSVNNNQTKRAKMKKIKVPLIIW